MAPLSQDPMEGLSDVSSKTWTTDSLTQAFSEFLPLLDTFVVTAGVALPALKAHDEQLRPSDLDEVGVVRSVVLAVQGSEAMLLNTATSEYIRNVFQALADKQGIRVGYNPVSLAYALINDYEVASQWQNNVSRCIRRIPELNEDQAAAARTVVERYGTADGAREAVQAFVHSLGEEGDARLAVRELRQSTATLITSYMVTINEAGAETPTASTRFVELVDHEMQRMKAAGESGIMGGVVSEDPDADAEIEDEEKPLEYIREEPEEAGYDPPPAVDMTTENLTKVKHNESYDHLEDAASTMSLGTGTAEQVAPEDYVQGLAGYLPDVPSPDFPADGVLPDSEHFSGVEHIGDMVGAQDLVGVSVLGLPQVVGDVQDAARSRSLSEEAKLIAFEALKPDMGPPRLERMLPLFEQTCIYLSMVLVPDLVGDSGGLLKALTADSGNTTVQFDHGNSSSNTTTMDAIQAADGLGYLLGRDSGFNPVDLATRMLGRPAVEACFHKVLEAVWKGEMSYEQLEMATRAVEAIGKGFEAQGAALEAVRDQMTVEQHNHCEAAVADATAGLLKDMVGPDDGPSVALLNAIGDLRAETNTSMGGDALIMEAELIIGGAGWMHGLLTLMEDVVFVHGVAMPLSGVSISPVGLGAQQIGPPDTLTKLLGTGHVLGASSGFNPVEVMVAVMGNAESTKLADEIESLQQVIPDLGKAVQDACKKAIAQLRQGDYDENSVLRQLGLLVEEQARLERQERPDGPLQQALKVRERVVKQLADHMRGADGMPTEQFTEFVSSVLVGQWGMPNNDELQEGSRYDHVLDDAHGGMASFLRDSDGVMAYSDGKGEASARESVGQDVSAPSQPQAPGTGKEANVPEMGVIGTAQEGEEGVPPAGAPEASGPATGVGAPGAAVGQNRSSHVAEAGGLEEVLLQTVSWAGNADDEEPQLDPMPDVPLP